jgi:glutathionyl-hydroquinone reductase
MLCVRSDYVNRHACHAYHYFACGLTWSSRTVVTRHGTEYDEALAEVCVHHLLTRDHSAFFDAYAPDAQGMYYLSMGVVETAGRVVLEVRHATPGMRTVRIVGALSETVQVRATRQAKEESERVARLDRLNKRLN